jgi:hypothetical protein
VAGIRVAVELDAPVETAWAYLEQVERHVEWMADAVAITFDSEQRRGVGTSFVCKTKFGPIRLDDHMTITEWIAEERMGVHHTGLVSGTGAFELESIDMGRRTRFTWTEILQFPWYFGGPIGRAVAGPLVLKPVWRRNLESLAARFPQP